MSTLTVRSWGAPSGPRRPVPMFTIGEMANDLGCHQASLREWMARREIQPAVTLQVGTHKRFDLYSSRQFDMIRRLRERAGTP